MENRYKIYLGICLGITMLNVFIYLAGGRDRDIGIFFLNPPLVIVRMFDIYLAGRNTLLDCLWLSASSLIYYGLVFVPILFGKDGIAASLPWFLVAFVFHSIVFFLDYSFKHYVHFNP